MSDEQTETSPAQSTPDGVAPSERDVAAAAAKASGTDPYSADRVAAPRPGQSQAGPETGRSGTSDTQSKPGGDPRGGSAQPQESAQPVQSGSTDEDPAAAAGSGASAGSPTPPIPGLGGPQPPVPPAAVGQQAGAPASRGTQTGGPVPQPSQSGPPVPLGADGAKKRRRRKRSRGKTAPPAPGEDPASVIQDLLPKNPGAQPEADPALQKKLAVSLLTVRDKSRSADPDKPPAATVVIKSIAHGLGLLGPNAPVDPLLDQQLVDDLDGLGFDGNSLRGVLAKVDDADGEALRVHHLRSQFEATLDLHRECVTSAFINFDYKFKSVDTLRLNLLRQAQAVFLLFDAFEKNLNESVDSVSRQTQSLSGTVQGLDSKFKQLDQLAFDIEERALAMREAVRRAGAEVRGAGPASQRAAFMGAVVGATAGGFFASVILFAAWVVLG